MSETLYISNFKAIKEAQIEIKPITLLIGEQASGKSTIAKLAYFFQRLPVELIQILAQFAEADHQELGKYLENKFKLLLVNYFGSTRLSATYTYRTQRKVSISGETITLPGEFYEISENYERHYRSLDTMALLHSNNEALLNISLEQQVLRLFGVSNSGLVYMPASRNMAFSQPSFSSLLLSENVNPDNGLNETIFKRYIVFSNNLIKRYYFREKFDNVPTTNLYLDRIQKNMLRVMKAKDIIRDDFGEKIVMHNGKTEYLMNASSGQQEVWRIFQDLSLILTNEGDAFRVIEEPESHLFPKAQALLMESFALVANGLESTKRHAQFILPTHSPYMLVALNNLLKAGQLGSNHPDELSKIIPREAWLNTDMVAAYQMKTNSEGMATAVSMIEDGLINAEMIDAVSEELNERYSNLLDIEFASHD